MRVARARWRRRRVPWQALGRALVSPARPRRPPGSRSAACSLQQRAGRGGGVTAASGQAGGGGSGGRRTPAPRAARCADAPPPVLTSEAPGMSPRASLKAVRLAGAMGTDIAPLLCPRLRPDGVGCCQATASPWGRRQAAGSSGPTAGLALRALARGPQSADGAAGACTMLQSECTRRRRYPRAHQHACGVLVGPGVCQLQSEGRPRIWCVGLDWPVRLPPPSARPPCVAGGRRWRAACNAWRDRAHGQEQEN